MSKSWSAETVKLLESRLGPGNVDPLSLKPGQIRWAWRVEPLVEGEEGPTSVSLAWDGDTDGFGHLILTITRSSFKPRYYSTTETWSAYGLDLRRDAQRIISRVLGECVEVVK